jgi:ferric-dicitrate binding protein FerR (iron transport regulator)
MIALDCGALMRPDHCRFHGWAAHDEAHERAVKRLQRQAKEAREDGDADRLKRVKAAGGRLQLCIRSRFMRGPDV